MSSGDMALSTMGCTGPIVNPPDSGNAAFWNYVMVSFSFLLLLKSLGMERGSTLIVSLLEGETHVPDEAKDYVNFVYHPRRCLEPHLSTLIFLAGNVLQAITLLIVSIFIFAICRRADRILKAATIASRDLTQYPSIHPALIQIFITVGLFFVQLIMRIVEGAQGAYAYAATHPSLFTNSFLSIFLDVMKMEKQMLKGWLS
ncbi:hypothetical protein I309_03207 [Cryptococcus deuterogattii LA55]|nr:hypothetical protein I309_03207 [Cryptococcus deuterogattii LA55]KIR35454.1 hypothetical protein I352_01729 [Cryptococcus deuterogattii MMRL2647]KIR90518.1 hypothetical protein I304_05660 [Cryptococcus deuterogattii CBS 10090]KIR97250.1 hypothetical protein L804_05432 [Cryptococcus deuterogattii 2001/935-1]